MRPRIFLATGVSRHLFRLVNILALALFLFYIPSVVKADEVVLLDFDSPLPPNLGQTHGVFLSTIIIGPDGASHGTFGGVVLLPTPAAVSPPQAAFAAHVNPLSEGVNGILAHFVFTTSEGVLVPAGTQILSFDVVGSQGTWTILFFDTTNRLAFDVQTGLIATITGNTDQSIVFGSFDRIGGFIFIPSGQNVLEGIDNLRFQATNVPEPASLLLLTICVGGLLARKRYKRFHGRSK